MKHQTPKFIALACLGFSVTCQPVLAQSFNSAPFQQLLTLQNSGTSSALAVHRNSLGKPCLDIEAASRAHVVNPNVYDHIVSVFNHCNQLIKLRVCYFGSAHCIDMDIPAFQRKDGILGIYPMMRYFRYSYREKS